MAPQRVVLMSCGSYNPPTNMHLRMFELARDHLHRMGTHRVVGGVISPVHDSYFRKELILASSSHRCEMLKLALQSSDWIYLSTWEVRQNSWTKTRATLQHHQNLLNSVLQNANMESNFRENEDMQWIPEDIENDPDTSPIQIKLLCGADLLESFAVPNLWMEEDINKIVGQHGLVVITRERSEPHKFISDSDILYKYINNIFIITEWIPNEISSSKVRRALKRGESIKYLIPDPVIGYIYEHELYDAKKDLQFKLKLSYDNANYLNTASTYENVLLTPSSSDFIIQTPSPVEDISVDVSDSVLKKNFENSSRFGQSKRGLAFEAEQSRGKMIRIADNENQIPTSSKDICESGKEIEAADSQFSKEVGSQEIESANGKTELDENVEKKVPSNSKKKYVCICDSQVSLYSSTENILSKNEASKITIQSSSENEISTVKFEPGLSTKASDTSHISGENESQSLAKIESLTNDMDGTNDSTNAQISTASEISNTEKELDSSVLNNETIKDSHCLKTEPEPTAHKNGKKSDDSCQFVEDAESSDSKKRDSSLEIDGKYLKSLVNSKKSPKKQKADAENPMSSTENAGSWEEPRRRSSRTRKKEKDANRSSSESFGSRYRRYWGDDDEDEDASPVIRSSIAKKPLRKVPSMDESKQQCQSIFLQSSLDFINIDIPKSSGGIKQFEMNSKKSKSYESIKRGNAKLTLLRPKTDISQSVSATFKSDSTSRLVTTNDFDMPTEEFCSVCYLPNDPSSAEIFYTLRSNCSSPADDDSTKCDICSSWNLQADSEVLDQSAPQESESLYETCEICGEPAAGFEEGSTSLEKRSLPLSVSLTRSSLRIDEGDRLLEEDHFEIENCGLKVGKARREEENAKADTSNDLPEEEEDSKVQVQGSENQTVEDALVFQETMNLVPKDEIAMGKSAKRFSRKGSIMKKTSEERSQDRRLYASVDNLQNSKLSFKMPGDKLVKSKATKHMTSADNIRSARNYRGGSFRRSADNIGRYDSSGDNLDSLEENCDKENEETEGAGKKSRLMNTETIEMILTEHGIKIISEKETVL